MIDVQNYKDNRNIPIDKVGVKDIRYPITLLDKNKETQSTIASFNMYVDLPHNFKGTHMSRFIEILNEYHNGIHVDILPEILKKMKHSFEAKNAHLEISFPYFISKKAPVSRAESLMEYNCEFSSFLSAENKIDLGTSVSVPIMTLCPCSKEISNKGAHNQRGIVKVSIKSIKNKLIWIEDIIDWVESCASTDVYALLKRPDEKYVTEKAYENPKFVEDVVRDVAEILKSNKDITSYRVSVENYESIHNHSAYAFIKSLETISRV